jgi:hypothetical protein
MGLWSSKAQSILLVFYSANSINVSRMRTKGKKEKRAGSKKISVKKHKLTPSSIRGLATYTGEKSTAKVNKVDK